MPLHDWPVAQHALPQTTAQELVPPPPPPPVIVGVGPHPRAARKETPKTAIVIRGIDTPLEKRRGSVQHTATDTQTHGIFM
jgi:hypothetical protein